MSRDQSPTGADGFRSRPTGIPAELGGVCALAASIGGVIVHRLLLVGAAGCVFGAIANVGLAASGSGGSYALGAALLGAAFGAMIVATLLRRLFAARAS